MTPARQAKPRLAPQIAVSRRSRVPGVSAASVRSDARRVLFALGENAAEVTISLVGDKEIHELNRTYRGKDRPTDVLAFAMREGESVPAGAGLLGDVVISLETAASQARRGRRSVADEVRVLLVHGILHLLGYDHERSAAEARRMHSAERRLRRLLEGRSPPSHVDHRRPS